VAATSPGNIYRCQPVINKGGTRRISKR